MFSIHIFIQYGIICPFAQFPIFIHYDIISHFKYKKNLQTFIRVQCSQHSFNTKGIKKTIMGFHVCMVGALLLLRAAFDDDSALTRSLLLNLFTQYLCDDKNNALNIFMLSGSIHLSLHFILTQIMRFF